VFSYRKKKCSWYLYDKSKGVHPNKLGMRLPWTIKSNIRNLEKKEKCSQRLDLQMINTLYKVGGPKTEMKGREMFRKEKKSENGRGMTYRWISLSLSLYCYLSLLLCCWGLHLYIWEVSLFEIITFWYLFSINYFRQWLLEPLINIILHWHGNDVFFNP